jgi:hypothetical protein
MVDVINIKGILAKPLKHLYRDIRQSMVKKRQGKMWDASHMAPYSLFNGLYRN